MSKHTPLYKNEQKERENTLMETTAIAEIHSPTVWIPGLINGLGGTQHMETLCLTNIQKSKKIFNWF